MAEKIQKRAVSLTDLDDVVAEAVRLYDSGYRSKGQWNLAQTCFHLAEWSRFPMDGFPKPPLFLRAIFGFMRITGVSNRMKASILKDGFKAGTPTAPETVGQPDSMEDQAAIDELGAVIERMKNFQGDTHPSPLFGQMDRDLWHKVTVLHAEHHFGFLEPV